MKNTDINIGYLHMAAIGCGNKTTKNSDIIEQEIEENITKENEQMRTNETKLVKQI